MGGGGGALCALSPRAVTSQKKPGLDRVKLWQLKFFKILVFALRIKFSFQFVSFICRFLQPETLLNFSNFDRQDFLKIQNFDVNDVIMT